MRRQKYATAGEGVAFVSGIDTPVIGSHAKCVKERKLALIAKGSLKELLTERAYGIESSSAVDKTQSHRPLVNIERMTKIEDIERTLLQEGFARPWTRRRRNDWCD